jgi:hypothetical protein
MHSGFESGDLLILSPRPTYASNTALWCRQLIVLPPLRADTSNSRVHRSVLSCEHHLIRRNETVCTSRARQTQRQRVDATQTSRKTGGATTTGGRDVAATPRSGRRSRKQSAPNFPASRGQEQGLRNLRIERSSRFRYQRFARVVRPHGRRVQGLREASRSDVMEGRGIF